MNKQKILIVDDDENIAELVSLYLTKETLREDSSYLFSIVFVAPSALPMLSVMAFMTLQIPSILETI